MHLQFDPAIPEARKPAKLVLIVVDLEPLMHAGGYCVIITSDAKEFLHVHPGQEKWV